MAENSEESSEPRTDTPTNLLKNEESCKTKGKNGLRIEDVYEQLGGFSKFQFFATAVILSLEIPGAMIALSPVLTTTNNVHFYCIEKDGSSSSFIIPKDELCSYNCSGQISSMEPYKSIVQEWTLICDKSWISDALTSLFMSGSALGPLITAQISDRFGRKPAFYLVCLLLTASGLLGSQAQSLVLFAVSKLFSGFACGGVYMSCLTYLMEFLTPSYRIICGCVSLWPLGEMLLALVGYLSPDWRTLTWISIIPAAVLVLFLPFIPESPRWLLCRNRTKEAGQVLDQIARWNGRQKISSATLSQLQKDVLHSNNTQQTESGLSSRWSNFKQRSILLSISILFLAWFSNALTYYGISFNMKNMSGNPYLNVFLLGVLDAPAELSGMYFSNRFGRKSSFISFLLVSVVFLSIVAGTEIFFQPREGSTLAIGVLVFCLAARFFNETSFAIMTCFTGESFPTVIRSMCFSICTTASSLGGIVAPQMAFLGTLWAPTPYLIFIITCVISSLISLMLKETTRKPLHDIAEHQEEL